MEEHEILEIINDREKSMSLIRELACDICAYSERFEIIENPELDLYDEKDAPYLRFPFAVKLFIEEAKRYLNKPCEYILYVNENLDGLIWWYEDTPISVDHYGWIYIGYSDALCQRIISLEYENQKLRKQLGDNHDLSIR